MISLTSILTESWCDEVKKRFSEGLITYERQLQAVWYRALKGRLDSNFEVWIEPVFYLSEDYDNSRPRSLTKPDLVITWLDKIVAVIELKCLPWGYPSFQGDIHKLIEICYRDGYPDCIAMGWRPTSPSWYKQEKEESELGFQLEPSTLFGFAVIAHPNSGSVDPNNIVRVFENVIGGEKTRSHFFHLTGMIHFDGSIEFSHYKLIDF